MAKAGRFVTDPKAGAYCQLVLDGGEKILVSHDIKGQAIAAFVTVKSGVEGSPQLMDELKAHVSKKIGSLARPDDIIFSAELPKTRSGKIMRRLLRDIAEGRTLGDTTTLADPTVVAALKDKYESEE